MGLENGVAIKNKSREQISFFWPFRFLHNENGDVDVCYWRKCWGIREHTLLHIIGTNDEGGEYKVNAKQVGAIRKLIKSFLGQPDWWESNSFWSFQEAKEMLCVNLWNLWWLRLWMFFHRKETVVFYDSF